jgi:putative NADH-flavin reductase
MTRTGSAKRVDAGYAMGRLRKAVAFQEAAVVLAEQLDRILDADVIHTNVILALIAYSDAITAAYSGQANQKDHMAVVKLLRDTLGKALPDAQERRLTRLLGRKDEMSYGARIGRSDDIQQAIEHLDAFATWAREKLTERGITLT